MRGLQKRALALFSTPAPVMSANTARQRSRSQVTLPISRPKARLNAPCSHPLSRLPSFRAATSLTRADTSARRVCMVCASVVHGKCMRRGTLCRSWTGPRRRGVLQPRPRLDLVEWSTGEGAAHAIQRTQYSTGGLARQSRLASGLAKARASEQLRYHHHRRRVAWACDGLLLGEKTWA